MLLQGKCPFKVYEMHKDVSSFISKVFHKEWGPVIQKRGPLCAWDPRKLSGVFWSYKEEQRGGCKKQPQCCGVGANKPWVPWSMASGIQWVPAVSCFADKKRADSAVLHNTVNGQYNSCIWGTYLLQMRILWISQSWISTPCLMTRQQLLYSCRVHGKECTKAAMKAVWGILSWLWYFHLLDQLLN